MKQKKKKIKKKVVVLVLAGLMLTGLSSFSRAAGSSYIVQPGDSLWKIANKFETSISTLRQMNNIWTNYLEVGQRLLVPGNQSTYYTVVWGDSLWKISRKTNVSIDQLKAANNLTSNYIEVGQRLIIPQAEISQPTPTPEPTPAPTIQLSASEIELLARLIHAEAAGEPYQGKVAVGAVIINRLKSPLFPNTLEGVVHQKYAFESVETGYIWTVAPTSSEYQAATEALNGVDPTKNAHFFYNPDKIANPNNWIFSRQVTIKIGDHLFAI